MFKQSLIDALTPAPAPLDSDIRRAAVSLIFDDQAHLLLVRRTERVGDPWSGNIALPGGHVDTAESFFEAACRETSEEVGLRIGPSDLVGRLADVTTPSIEPIRWVRPFVFVLSSRPALVLETREVAATHWFPLKSAEREDRPEFHVDYKGRRFAMPFIPVGDAKLWGMTLKIVDDLLRRLRRSGANAS